jgi:hypothetical protein
MQSGGIGKQADSITVPWSMSIVAEVQSRDDAVEVRRSQRTPPPSYSTPAEEPEHLPAHFFFMVFGINLAIHHPMSAHGRLMFCFVGEEWGDILLYCH